MVRSGHPVSVVSPTTAATEVSSCLHAGIKLSWDRVGDPYSPTEIPLRTLQTLVSDACSPRAPLRARPHVSPSPLPWSAPSVCYVPSGCGSSCVAHCIVDPISGMVVLFLPHTRPVALHTCPVGFTGRVAVRNALILTVNYYVRSAAFVPGTVPAGSVAAVRSASSSSIVMAPKKAAPKKAAKKVAPKKAGAKKEGGLFGNYLTTVSVGRCRATRAARTYIYALRLGRRPPHTLPPPHVAGPKRCCVSQFLMSGLDEMEFLSGAGRTLDDKSVGVLGFAAKDKRPKGKVNVVSKSGTINPRDPKTW